jgi:hypothetical protein
MSSNNPYGPYPGPPGQPEPGQQPGPSTPYGYPQQPPSGGQPGGSGYTFGPFAPQGGPPPGPNGPQGPNGPYGPPPGYGPQPPGGPGGPPKKSNKRVAIIAAAAAAVVLAGGTGIVLATRGNETVTPTTNSTQAQTPGPGGQPSSAPPAGPSASDAVTGYLQALATGDAKTAISYSAVPLKSGGTLSRSVLVASNKRAKLTEINVTPVTDENAASVDATYKLGSKSVSESFPVVKDASGGWKLSQVVADVSLGTAADAGVPLRINGVTTKSDTVSLFPGSYVVTSGLKTVSYGSHNTLLVQRPSDLPSTSRLRLTMTTTGKKVARSAARKSYRSCLQAKATVPKDCPFALNPGDFKINNSTIKWSQRGSDPFKKAKFLLAGRSIGVRIKLDVVLNADCTSNGRAATCSGNVTQPRVGYVLSTNPKRKVVWRAG